MIRQSTRIWWGISFAVSIFLWVLTARHLLPLQQRFQRDSFQLYDQETTNNYLDSYWLNSSPEQALPVEVPTGIFIQSIKWEDAFTFHISGFIWQKFDLTSTTEISRGVIFPEAIDFSQEENYRRRDGDIETIGWYFEGKIRQSFDYTKYPFDHKIIRVRLWPKDFDQRALLTPSFSSYDKNDRDSTFGLDPEIAVSGYDIAGTYFRYQHTHYDTNFGLTKYTSIKRYPELYFNVILKRHVIDAVIINILPLLAVLILCFSSLLSITFDAKKRDIYNFRYLEILTQGAALFFVLLLAHIHIRETFEGIGIVYLEYIYVVAYMSIVYITLNAYLVVHAELNNYRFYHLLTYKDNLVVKAAFLPIVSAAIYIICKIFF